MDENLKQLKSEIQGVVLETLKEVFSEDYIEEEDTRDPYTIKYHIIGDDSDFWDEIFVTATIQPRGDVPYYGLDLVVARPIYKGFIAEYDDDYDKITKILDQLQLNIQTHPLSIYLKGGGMVTPSITYGGERLYKYDDVGNRWAVELPLMELLYTRRLIPANQTIKDVLTWLLDDRTLDLWEVAIRRYNGDLFNELENLIDQNLDRWWEDTHED